MDSQAPVFIRQSYTWVSKGVSRKLYITGPTQKQVRDCHVITHPLHPDSTKNPDSFRASADIAAQVQYLPRTAIVVYSIAP